MAVVTAKGREIIWNRLKGSGSEPVNLAWGNNPASLSEASTDVAMFKEASESRVVGASSLVTTTTTNDTYQATGTFTSASGQTIAEVGLFDSSTKPTAVDSVQTGSGVIGSSSSTSLTVATGGNFAANEYIQVRTEVMKITSIASNVLTVTRAQNGTTAISTIASGDTVTGGNPPGNTAVTGGSMAFHSAHGAQTLSTNDQVSYTLTIKLT